MPKPRVFISSTFYDLKHVRASLETFVEQLGFEPVLSEKGSIAYDPDLALDESCYREVHATDIFVLIIGGRYGSEVSSDKLKKSGHSFYERFESITKREYETAINRDLPTYILIEKPVYAEYQTFQNNRKNDSIQYAHVNSVNVFHFLDFILSRPRNNPVFQFERHSDIQTWLREQWAGLFRDLLSRRSEAKRISSLADQVAELSSVSATLKRYLETVVSKVGGENQDTANLIATEERRLNLARRKREALKADIVSELINLYGLSEDQVFDAYSRATSIEDLARLISLEADEISEVAAIDHWHKNPQIADEINHVRHLLGKEPLKFLSINKGKPAKEGKEKDGL